MKTPRYTQRLTAQQRGAMALIEHAMRHVRRHGSENRAASRKALSILNRAWDQVLNEEQKEPEHALSA